MQSLLRRKQNHITESLIKESLLRQLSYSVKEVQFQYSRTNAVFTTNEACNSLLVVLEAIFLHGLKKGIFRTALSNIGGLEDAKPEPSFWSMVKNYMHEDTLNTIKKLSHIKTDVGRCRVWLRVALNQMEITSYFQAMEKERRPVNNCYNNFAFLRDRETCDTACKLLDGIVAVQFDIPINAGILNTWNTEPLIMSGIWSPAMKIPISSAVDVVEELGTDYEDDNVSFMKTSSSITTLSNILALDENQALKIILDAPLRELEKEEPGVTAKGEEAEEKVAVPEDEDEEEEEEVAEVAERGESVPNNLGNSLSNAPGWSSGETAKEELAPKAEESKTFSGLLESCGHSEDKSYRNIMQTIMKEKEAVEEAEELDFQIISEPCEQYEDYMFKIVREKGLKSQNYTCFNCQLSIGLDFDEARLCHFTGKYYCKNCHANDVSVIPSRLLYNWDHKKYPVCSRVHAYLTDVSQRTVIDVKKLNPKIYKVVSEMQRLRALRFKLNLLRAYLYTCREPVLGELRKRVYPRDYLYEHVHSYTLSDLCKVPGGGLLAELDPLVTFAREHVLACSLCSQKGFICEICRNPKVIYPFDSESTYHCGKCYSVYHEGCVTSPKNCSKCKRLEKRAEMSSKDQDESE